jgi:hypothetical protein
MPGSPLEAKNPANLPAKIAETGKIVLYLKEAKNRENVRGKFGSAFVSGSDNSSCIG